MQFDPNHWVAIFTGLLVLVGFLQLFVFGTQARRLRETIDQMKSAEQRELRAYVSVESGSITPITGQIQPAAHLILRNTGKTPAYQLTHWAHIVVDHVNLQVALPGIGPMPAPLPTITIGPFGGSTKSVPLGRTITQQEYQDILAGTKVVYVYGIIEYEDAFGEKRHTRYKSMHGVMSGQVGVSTDLTFCPDGNEAN